MTLLESLYTSALRVATLAAPALSIGESKLARGVRGRRESLDRIEAWAARARDRSRPLIWFHAPSVGEGFQARAVIGVLRELEPQVQIAYTYFSPSAETFARDIPADVSDYLPLDLPARIARLFDALHPTVVSFTKTEVWPNITAEAARRGTPTVLLSATLPSTSSRIRGPARALLTPAHRRLRCVAAISPADGDRFKALGVPTDRITVMGDARFDQVWRRVGRPFADGVLLDSVSESDRLTIVAGSTWPEDEEHLVSAFAAITERVTPHSVRLIIAPHEPTPGHLSELVARLRGAALSFALLGDAVGVATRPSVVVVDRLGVLGDLYRLADFAFVGGGFGHDGLHSVLEPAAFGAPVIFGPNHANAREAAELIEVGAARAVHDGRELISALFEWVDDSAARRRAGSLARQYVENGLGAADRGAEIIRSLLDEERAAEGNADPSLRSG